jgi:23S rRNA pseudouridine2605 synthase
MINGKKTSKARAKIKKIDKKNNTCIVELIIHEGKNHQVKNMFEAINYTILKLKRERFGLITAEGLKSGEYRPLSVKEIKILYGEFAKQKK